MSARVVLAVAAVLTAGLARADDMHKVAPMEKVGASDSGAPSSPGTTWTKDSSAGSHSYTPESSSDSHAFARSRTGSQSSSSAGQRHGSARSRGGESRTSPPPQTAAQRRHPRPGTGTGHFDNNGHGGGYGYGYPYYGYGYGYGRYGYGYGYYPYNSWYSPFYFSGYYGYSPSYYRGGGNGYRDSGSLRIIVDPEKTRVYVDGYYAGIVDDFDGVFQRLNVPPGRHEITLKLEGYRTQHFKVYVPVSDTIKIHYDMVRGSGEATSEQFAGVPADYARVEDMSDRRGDDNDGDDRYEGRDESRDQADTGSVRLQVTPQDASVYVDGEFRGSGRQAANLRLPPGRHRIEVVRPGFRTVEREVEVQAGRSTEVEFDLEKL